jgi:hypothetical protein
MFDLDCIVSLNNKWALRDLKRNLPMKGRSCRQSRSNQELVKTLHLFLSLDMKTANYDLVLKTCEQMMDVAFEFAPKAIEGLYRKGEHHA